METHCVSCKKYTGSENSNVRKAKQNGDKWSYQIVLFVTRKDALL